MRAVAFLLVLLAAGPALAYHTDEERLTDGTADTLRSLETRLGVWKLEGGVTDDIMVGTYTWPWLFLTPNISAKWRFWTGEQLSLAASLLIARLDFSRFNPDAPVTLTIVPMGLAATWRNDATHTFSAGFTYTLIRLKGETPESDDLKGAAAATNAQGTASWEWRLSKYTALVTEARVQFFQVLSLSAETTFQVDPWTRYELVAVGESDAIDFKSIWSVVPSFVWSYKYASLRLGLGWGNFNISPVNFAIPAKFVVPEADLYVRF